MPEAIPVERLEVIGYADTLDSGMLPSIVPPVFRFADQPDKVFVPPYALNAGFLCRAAEIGQTEARELHEAGEMVLFDSPFPARTDFDLWIDESNEPRYETRSVARSNLKNIANHSIRQAKIALESGRLVEAERFCSSAISADDKCLEALVIKAAIRRRENDAGGESLMAELASPWLDRLSFRKLVDGYGQSEDRISTQARTSKIPPMRGIAMCKAA